MSRYRRWVSSTRESNTGCVYCGAPPADCRSFKVAGAGRVLACSGCAQSRLGFPPPVHATPEEFEAAHAQLKAYGEAFRAGTTPVGSMPAEDDEGRPGTLELANCPCGSTLAMFSHEGGAR